MLAETRHELITRIDEVDDQVSKTVDVFTKQMYEAKADIAILRDGAVVAQGERIDKLEKAIQELQEQLAGLRECLREQSRK